MAFSGLFRHWGGEILDNWNDFEVFWIPSRFSREIIYSGTRLRLKSSRLARDTLYRSSSTCSTSSPTWLTFHMRNNDAARADDRAASSLHCIELQSPEQDLRDYCINICTILDDSGHMTTIGSFVGSSSSWKKKYHIHTVCNCSIGFPLLLRWRNGRERQ